MSLRYDSPVALTKENAMSITWKEFKEEVEKNGVKDNSKVRFIDINFDEQDKIIVNIFQDEICIE
jgi:hypothetical protein